MGSATTQVRSEGSIQSQLSPVIVDEGRMSRPATVEVVHETRGLIGCGASQQISADVSVVHREIDERVENHRSEVSSGLDSDVVRTRVTTSRELRSCAIVDGTEIDAVALVEVLGLTAIDTVTDETEVLHANGRQNSIVSSLDVRKTNRQDGSREVNAPVVGSFDLSAMGIASVTVKINQEEIVVKESSRNESVSSSGSGEELGLHQTDVNIDGEGTKVAAVGELRGRSVEGAKVVSVVVELTNGTAEGKRGDDVTNGGEVALGERVEERGGPDKVGDDEALDGIPFSTVRIEVGEGALSGFDPVAPARKADAVAALLEG